MTRFLSNTITDVRSGRQSWRVLATIGTLAFVVSFIIRTLEVMG
jgi:hypothetical protein